MKVKNMIAILLISCTILSGCNNFKKVTEVWTMTQEKAFSFADGTYVNLWRCGHRMKGIYKLPDDTTLLTVKDSIGPSGRYVGDIESLDHLSENAQKNINSYYNEQGLLYDMQTELNKVYDEYLKCKKNGTKFREFTISHDVMPTSSSDNIMCFLTIVQLPLGRETQLSHNIRLSAVFDKKTGEALNIWDLFSASETETKKQLLDATQITDLDLKSEFMASLKAEYIVLYPDCIDINFPQGVLPSQKDIFSVAIEYYKLQGIIHDWAIPYPTEE